LIVWAVFLSASAFAVQFAVNASQAFLIALPKVRVEPLLTALGSSVFQLKDKSLLIALLPSLFV